ncbi:ATG3 [Candida oxycetoniae]|uniref:Autophagy-related protein 3 n=1 Tax=Candida oxycetoniae TaxID=497107 RepID=A0AAI9SXJ7_9ASCO|nr:ATG3 [Candida oxycetoniae]KAI3404640.2 ATG3 [Candida oxycetoniae]
MLRSKLSSLREYLTPINHTSNFLTTGEISPEEFVEAGDYLVYKFPTWQWASCPKNLQKSFLPKEKQVLVTKHVPSNQRAANYYEEEIETDFEDRDLVVGKKEEGNASPGFPDDEDYGWIRCPKSSSEMGTGEISDPQKAIEVNDIDELIDENAEGNEELNDNNNNNNNNNNSDDDDDYDDGDGNDDFDDLDIVNNSDKKLRKYDLYITYSTSYRVPKMYLVGFDSNGIPLLPKQMFEDINSDYKDKTATIENLPVAYNTTSVSIHPCKHASVMKVLMKHQRSKKAKPDITENIRCLSIGEHPADVAPKEDEDDEIRVDQYLIIFLKFLASVTPGIEYDYTMDAL